MTEYLVIYYDILYDVIDRLQLRLEFVIVLCLFGCFKCLDQM